MLPSSPAEIHTRGDSFYLQGSKRHTIQKHGSGQFRAPIVGNFAKSYSVNLQR